MSKNTLLSELINYISANSSGNVVIAAPTSGFALDVTGTGRFTGALSGTSATFSGQVNAASKYTWGSSTTGTTGQIATDGTNNYFDYIGSLIFRGAAASNTLVTFTNTGDATFSSSVTATNYVASGGNNTTVFNSASATTGWVQMAMNNTSGSSLFGVEGSTAGTLATGTLAYSSVLRNYTNTAFHIATNNTVRLTISGAGAATFSSSVTADSFLVNRAASRNMLGISSTSLPTSGDEEGVAVIKTNSSLWQLSLVGYAATSKGLRIYNNGGSGYTSFEVSQAAATRFIVNGDGNIGINNSGESASKLYVTGSDSGSSNYALTLRNSGGAELLQARNDGVIYLKGNVGIGTYTPNSSLAISISAFSNAGLKSYTTDNVGGISAYVNNQDPYTGYLDIYATRSGNDGTLGGSIIRFLNQTTSSTASAVERMRITTEGYTKMSNMGTYYGSTFHEIRSNNTNNALQVSNTNATPYGIWIHYPNSSQSTTNYEFIYTSNNTESKFIVWSNGSVINRTGSYGTISDVKFKENIVDASPKLGDIAKLKVRNFNLIGDSTKQIGFIAQEFEEVFPNMVDVSTERGTDGETYKSIKTSVLVPMLVKAIQELNDKVKTLENK